MSEEEVVATQIPHDGFKSRRWIGSSIASGVTFVTAVALVIISGLIADKPFFSADYWVKSLWVCCAILAFGWGFLTVDKAIEMLRMVLPLLGKKNQ